MGSLEIGVFISKIQKLTINGMIKYVKDYEKQLSELPFIKPKQVLTYVEQKMYYIKLMNGVFSWERFLYQI